MADVNAILNQRMKKNSNMTKMAEMAKQSSNGNLTSFSGVFPISELSVKEKELIESILSNYASADQDTQDDLKHLISITSEVKAINNQAALLHGERIKKAHQILIRYRDGAFTAWLISTYGNRQTPYNLMQYYEFCEAMPRQLRPQIELMPRQAIYVLATREGSLDKKREIIESYQGETKDEMLALIRQSFPLDRADRRQRKMGPLLIQELQKITNRLQGASFQLSAGEKKQILAALAHLQRLVSA